MALVALVPLVVSHLILIGINRDSLQTLEKQYLTRSAVQISNDLQNLLVSNRQQMNKIASSIVLSGEVPLGRMRSLGGQWIYNKEYRSLEQDMATLLAVTPESLRKLMSDYPFDPMTIVSLGPKEKAT